MSDKLYFFTVADTDAFDRTIQAISEEDAVWAWSVRDGDGEIVCSAGVKHVLDKHGVKTRVVATLDADLVPVFYHNWFSAHTDCHWAEDSIKALAVALGGIAITSVGHNCERELAERDSSFVFGNSLYTYFSTKPESRNYIWRAFADRDDAVEFMAMLCEGDPNAVGWAQAIPCADYDELLSKRKRVKSQRSK